MNSLPATPEGRDARVTIDDVARLAGVSKATVSRFLNHRTTRLTPEIAARVEKAVAELAYMPSPMAQALKRGRTRLLGLVVADITNPVAVAVLRGAENAAQQAGYLVMLFNLGNGAMADGPFGRDPRVREAFEKAIDRMVLNRVVLRRAGRTVLHRISAP